MNLKRPVHGEAELMATGQRRGRPMAGHGRPGRQSVIERGEGLVHHEKNIPTGDGGCLCVHGSRKQGKPPAW
jgi:hypothetical protein